MSSTKLNYPKMREVTQIVFVYQTMTRLTRLLKTFNGVTKYELKLNCVIDKHVTWNFAQNFHGKGNTSTKSNVLEVYINF